MKIKKNDRVKVLLGRDRGREGKVDKVLAGGKKVMVEGINMFKKNVKAREGHKGGIIDLVKPLLVSKVALVCPKCGKATRVGWQLVGQGKKRICKKCRELI
ncbi:MAG: 50S ribosomal protein L24 [Candidatus Shapirobacteria bacterium]